MSIIFILTLLYCVCTLLQNTNMEAFENTLKLVLIFKQMAGKGDISTYGLLWFDTELISNHGF